MSKEGGDVYLLDMGKPVKILDLARKMIRLSGLEVKDINHPNGDIEIIYTGLRPGEKLYEELLIGDKPLPTSHELILRSEEERLSWIDLEIILNKLATSIKNKEYKNARNLLIEAVPGFKPANEIDDLMFEDE